MKRAKVSKQQNSIDLPKDLNHLPDTVADLVPLYRAAIVRFDAAVHARDFEATEAARGEAHDVVERAHSLPRFSEGRTVSGYRYCFYDVARIFDRLTRATPGEVPLFGQSADFVASLSTTRIRFQMHGLAGDIGMSAYAGRAWGFCIRAVEWNRPFFSDTGYRSFLCSSLEVGERTDDVKLWCLGHVRHWWNGSGGRPTKFVLPRIRGSFSAPVPVEVEDEEDVCPDCGDFTENGGLCAGCRSNQNARVSDTKQLTLF